MSIIITHLKKVNKTYYLKMNFGCKINVPSHFVKRNINQRNIEPLFLRTIDISIWNEDTLRQRHSSIYIERHKYLRIQKIYTL